MTDSAAHPPSSTDVPSPDRRKLLAALGVGAAALGVPGIAVAAQRGGDGPGGRGPGGGDRRDRPGGGGPPDRGPLDGEPAGTDRFIRMFEDHPPFREADDELRAGLAELGRPGGILDADDPLEVGPIRLITEPELSPSNRDNPTQTAGSTFVGQFLDHDITNDAGSSLGRSTSVLRSANLRSARFDLDSVYGGGPAESRELYEPADPFTFRVESGGLFEDVPRDAQGTAVIGDPRNDENMIISGLQAAFLLFHNRVQDRVRAAGGIGLDAFEETRRTVQWHYQWLILNQFLPQYVGQAMVDDVLRFGRRYYTPRRAQVPVEFQTAAYRFGHSMVRPSYRANLAGDGGEPFFGMVFDPSLPASTDPDDLGGGKRAPRRFIGWQTFFDFGDGEVKPNKSIDTKLSTPLFNLPMGTIATTRGEEIGPLSLATRNLLRHITWGIPSGQDLAAEMGVDRLAAADLADIDSVVPSLVGQTPLWLYVLREADLVTGGLHLGPVGGRIVAEVFIGLLQMDTASYLAAEPDWRPSLPSQAGTGEFQMVDLLRMAGVDPTSRGQ